MIQKQTNNNVHYVLFVFIYNFTSNRVVYNSTDANKTDFRNNLYPYHTKSLRTRLW